MKAWVLHGKEDLRLEEMPVSDLHDHEVLIRVRQAGICGSDMAYYRDGKVGEYVPSKPFVAGHEFSGEIAGLGSAVGELKVGYRVAVDPSLSCGKCQYCLKGRSNLCLNMRYLGSAMYTPPVDGAFREYIVMPAKNCYILPDELSYETGAFLEPLAVSFHALSRAGDLKGKSVLITGAGTIGQLILSSALAMGARKVCVSDPVQSKRDLAVQRGACMALDPGHVDFENMAEELVPEGFHIVIEASGAVAALNQAIQLASRGATIVQVGIPPPKELIPLGLIFFKELEYKASFRFCDVFKEVLAKCASGHIRTEELVSRTFPFMELDKALRFACNTENSYKIHVRF